jgi:Zn ribbon nucleic-acid-binding protein
MCLRRAPEKYIAGAKAPAGSALDRAALWHMRDTAVGESSEPRCAECISATVTRGGVIAVIQVLLTGHRGVTA